ncbi:type I-E CRISPR-associated protein Cse1/CasA [Aromatoleum toluvorans]|uniref:Type I-E CRISPR-associated protein Cse1/CasA n=1 Tax=Aromatoleum toluvorans TaxID=92002 RepID=A0ABX1Q2M9_9RHOO|nr:type I-E CRISPR-associated protein Cse1/CasA [Aromatoleum toluvorans]NMG44765.1 type I-E CRISPR-associated protein Cse1/CasA [Aromatoleum toluvorans]
MTLIELNLLPLLDRTEKAEGHSPTAIARPDLIDIVAARPDFRSALYQFLIGLLQTTFAPEDEDEWLEYWESPPDENALKAAFAPWRDAFVLDGDGPAFMQDLDLPNGEEKPIASLLIDAPGDKTIRDNLDFFNKRDRVEAMCPACAAIALYALQINAPSGGVGHRVSLRGGGPLTCLLVPSAIDGTPPSLWHRLWLNVLPRNKIAQLNGSCTGQARSDILPWLAPTRTSERKDGQTTPDDAHPLQAYWSMPRRIRLDWTRVRAGHCDICGIASERLLTGYRTRNYGINYLGWEHPLTPYYHDPKDKELPLSMKGQKGGIGYRHWLGLVMGNADRQPESARVVRHYLTEKRDLLPPGPEPRLWVSGYDMDNMKARCWYDATLPVHSPPGGRENEFRHHVRDLLDVAVEAAKLLSGHVKKAWADRPGDLKDEPAIGQSFWQASETTFYRALDALTLPEGLEPVPLASTQRAWLRAVRKTALDLFDDWVTGEYEKDWDIERTVRARADLAKWLNAAKPMRAMWKFVNEQLKEPA